MAIDAGGGCDSSGGSTAGCTGADARAEAAAAQAEAAKAEAAKAEAAKAEAAKAAAAAVTNAPAVQAAFGVSSFTPASAPPAGMPSLQSPSTQALAQARADFDKVMNNAREYVQNRDLRCYTPEVLDQKVHEHLASQPRLEPNRSGPSISERIKDAYDQATKGWRTGNELLDGIQDGPRPNYPSRPTPPVRGR